MRTLVALTLCLSLLAGCSKPAPKDPAPVAGGGAPKSAADLLRKGIEDASERNAENYEIDEADDRWDPSKATLVSLGDAMDDKMASTKNALCEGVFSYDDPSVGTLNSTPQIRIQDSSHFELEYSLPETTSNLNRVRGDGARRARLNADGWQDLPKASRSSNTSSAKEVQEWPRRFPVEMFSQLVDGTESWGPLFRAWENGVGGYEAKLEEQTFTQGGSKASHYRVVARTKQGSPTTIELIIDKDHLRPLTIRVNGTLDDGRKYNMYWTGRWKTGGAYRADAFTIPMAQPKAS